MRIARALLSFALILTATPAAARPFRVSDIPNGDKNTCLNCHGDTKGSTRTDFGSDAQTYLEGPSPVQQQHVTWAPLCPLDSDGDGWTNGKELGDPDCTWKAGDPSPNAYVFNPGEPSSHPPPVCGNGKLDADEPCEGAMMSKTDCLEESAGDGQLGCTEKCRFDYSACSMPPDAQVDPGSDDPSPSVEEGCGVAGAGGRQGDPGALLLLFGLAAARAINSMVSAGSTSRPRRGSPRSR